MANWYEVFDHDEVALMTRRRAANLASVFTLALVATVAVGALHEMGAWPAWTLQASIVVVWSSASVLIAIRVHRLRRIVWCVKIGPEDLVGYDYTRRPHAFCWSDIAAIDVSSERLRLEGDDRRVLVIPCLFPDFSTLSHRIVEYAEKNAIPVSVDSMPIDTVGIEQLYPFLASESPAGESPAAN